MQPPEERNNEVRFLDNAPDFGLACTKGASLPCKQADVSSILTGSTKIEFSRRERLNHGISNGLGSYKICQFSSIVERAADNRDTEGQNL